MASPGRREVDARHEAEKNFKAEDRLGFDLSEHLAGRAPEVWRKYVAIAGNSLTFLLDAKSANHKAMAACLAYLRGDASLVAAARRYLVDSRLQEELQGGAWGEGEPLSNKYACWSLGSLALVWDKARDRQDAELVELASRYYDTFCIVCGLGATERPARNLVGTRWTGCYVAAPGVRSDPEHLEGDGRAFVLQGELFPGAPLTDVYRENALRRRAVAAKSGPFEDQQAEARRQKELSELWWVDALALARKRGLRMTEEHREALRSWLRGEPRAEAKGLLGHVGCRFTFHFAAYVDGYRANWLETPGGERAVFGDVISPDGTVQVLFPYNRDARNAVGGSLSIQEGRLVVSSAKGQAVLDPAHAVLALPPGKPVWHLVFGPAGLEDALA